MSFVITGARLLGYNHENKFLGDNFRYGSIKNYTVEGFFLESTNIEGVAKNLISESGFVRNLNEREEIIVNGYSLGQARINSISFNSNNPVRLDTYTINFDVLTSGFNDLYNFSGPIYTGLSYSLSGTASLLENFTENLTFNIDESDSYNYSHNLNIRYRKTSGFASPIDLAKNLAKNIFNNTLDLGFIDSKYSGFYAKTGKKYFTETYNLITNDCTFTKNFNLYNKYSGDYTLNLTDSFSFGGDGNVTITERGEIKGLKESRFFTASGAVENEIIKSYNRCNALLITYANSNNLTNYYPLFSTGIEINKNFNTFNGLAEYTISFTNNPIYTTTGYTRESTLTLSQDNLNIVEIEENGTIRKYGNKTGDFLFSNTNLTNIFNSAIGKISNFYIEQGYLNNLSLLNKNLSFPKYGNEISYSIRYSDDQIYNTNIPNVKKIIVKKTDNVPKHIYNQYIIPNKKVFYSAGGQTELGQRNVNLECVLQRPTQNIFISSNMLTPTILSAIKSKAITEMGLDTPDYQFLESFISNCTYSINSDFNLNFDLTVDYVSAVVQFNDEELL